MVIKCCDIGKFVCSSSATLLHKSEDKTKTKPKKSLIGKFLAIHGVLINHARSRNEEV